MSATNVKVTITFECVMDPDEFDEDGDFEGDAIERFRQHIQEDLGATALVSEYGDDGTVLIEPA